MGEKNSEYLLFIINLFHLICWFHIFILIIGYNMSSYISFIEPNQHLTFLLIILKITQTFQFSDTIFSLLKIAKGSTLGSLMQIMGRNYIVWFIMNSNSDKFYLSLILINWSFADSVRYLYYIIPNRFTKYLRFFLLFC